jgi:hypothetical protein
VRIDDHQREYTGEGLLRAERLHARLVEGLAEAGPLVPITPEGLAGLDSRQRMVFDAYLKRFEDAYETGKSLFRSGLLLAGLGWPKLNYVDLINEAERYGVLPSAAAWLDVRDVRNSAAHEYAMKAAQQAALLNDSIVQGRVLAEQLGAAIAFVRSRFSGLEQSDA